MTSTKASIAMLAPYEIRERLQFMNEKLSFLRGSL